MIEARAGAALAMMARVALLSSPRASQLLPDVVDWHRNLDPSKNPGSLATRAGPCAVYVGIILGLLRPHPAILQRIEALKAGGAGAEATERRLRPISKLPLDEQTAAVAERCHRGRRRSQGTSVPPLSKLCRLGAARRRWMGRSVSSSPERADAILA